LSPDTNQIKAATAELNTKYYKNAECIPALYEAAASSPNQGVSRARPLRPAYMHATRTDL
jgi:hypothetical protein